MLREYILSLIMGDAGSDNVPTEERKSMLTENELNFDQEYV